MPGYYDVPKTRYTCSNCQWSGLGATLAQGELFRELVEYDCPECGERVAFAAFPSREEAAAAARAGDEKAAGDLAGFDERGRRWERVLETQGRAVEDPPELAGGDVFCRLSLEKDEASEVWLVLTANGSELHREVAVFESTEPAHRLLAVMRERYGDRLRSFNYRPALLYLGGDRLGSVRELDGLVSDLPGGEGRPPEGAGSFYFIQDPGDTAPWALVAVRPRGLYEVWTGTEWVDMPFFAAYFVGGEIGARQIEPGQVEAMMATVKPIGPAALALMRATHRRPGPTSVKEGSVADKADRTAPVEVEFRSDVDAFRWMLATKSSPDPAHWIVTVIDPDGRRTVASGEAGRSHLFPTLPHSRHAEIQRMWPVGDHACHVEVTHGDTGETTRIQMPFVTCPHLDPRMRAQK